MNLNSDRTLGVDGDSRLIASRLLRAAATCETLRPANLLEITAFAAGAKSALRFVVSHNDGDQLLIAAAAINVRGARRRIYLETHHNGFARINRSNAGEPAELVTLARADIKPEDILDAELSDASKAGEQLGYPKCCVDALPQLDMLGPHWPLALITDMKDGEPVDARLNRFAAEWGGIGLLGELFPCSLKCTNAIAYANDLLSSAHALGLARLGSAAISDALVPVQIAPDGSIERGKSGNGRVIAFKW